MQLIGPAIGDYGHEPFMTPAAMHRAGRPIRLIMLAASPVYYQIPLYRRLATDPRLAFTAFYSRDGGARRPYNAGFGSLRIRWDADLLNGYDSTFAAKAESREFSHRFLALRDWDLARQLRSSSFDVLWVHGYSYLTLWLAMGAAWMARRPVLVREEQTLLHDRPWPKRWIRASILGTLFRNVYGLYLGSNNKRFFEHYGVHANRLFWVPMCADNAELQAAAVRLRPRQRELKQALGLRNPDDPMVLFVGKLTAKKRPDLLLDAYAEVRRRVKCALVFVGTGELELELRSCVRERGIPDVTFAGFRNRSQIAEVYAAADLFVLPSQWHETWGVVVNEAMNFALPIVVSDKVGSAVDLVHDGVNGHVVPAGDRLELSQAIERLVHNPDLRRQFGESSRRLVSRFHYEAAAEGIVEACGRAMANRHIRHDE